MQKTTNFPTRRLVLDAILIALYVLLGYFKIPIGNILRINMAPFAVVICAIAFGPVDGLIVGFMGEFLSQILGPYGLTPTTVLWALPEAVRGLTLGLSMVILRKKDRGMLLRLIACIVTGLLASLVNTFALYVDSKMFGYYNDYMVFGVLLIRLGLAVVTSGIFGYIAQGIIAPLRRNKLI